MIGVAIVGFGFMGRHHFKIYADSPKAQVLAVCDLDSHRLQGSSVVSGNVAQASTGGLDLTGVHTTTSFEEVLSDPAVQLIDITLPTYLHAEFATRALAAGKHVLCEKPIARTLEQADTILAAVRKAPGKFMVGHCLRFWPEYALVRDLLSERRFGRVYSAVFERISATPLWSWKNWLQDHQKSGGVCLALPVHDIAYINYLFGLPAGVTSFGITKTSGGVDHVFTRYHYGEDNFLVVSEGSWVSHSSYPFSMGFHIVCESATIDYNSGKTPSLVIYVPGQPPEVPDVPSGDGYSREIDYFLDCVISSSDPTVITAFEAREALQVALAEVESVQTGRRVDLKRS